MAIPFKPDHFRFRRQAGLEKELQASPLLRRINAFAGTEWDRKELQLTMAGGLELPPRVLAPLEQATLTLKTVARLPYEIRTLIARERDATWGCLALREDNRMTFNLTPTLLQECSATELVYHLAVAAFLTFQPVHNYLHRLLATRPPLELADRLKVLQLLRLGRYAADTFALVCCGRLDTVLHEGFHRYTGLKPAPKTLDFDQLALQSLNSGESNLADLLNDTYRQLGYVPIEPLVLKRFLETETCRACIGVQGGVSREEFETEVLELDRQAYPPLKELPADHQEFICTATLLAAYFVMEAGGIVTPRREATLLDFLGLEPKRLDEIAQQFGWQRTDETNTEAVLEDFLTGRKTHLSNLHSVAVLTPAFLFVAHEHAGKLPQRFHPAFMRLGSLCQICRSEVIAIYETVMEPKPEERERGE